MSRDLGAKGPSAAHHGMLSGRLGPGPLCCRAAMLAPGHISPQATKHKETVQDRAHVQLGQTLDKRYKSPKNPSATFEEPGVKKQRVRSKSRELHRPPCTQYH